MSICQTPNRALFWGDMAKNVGDIRDRKFVFPEKVGQNSSNHFRPAIPKAPIMPNFIKISETTLEKSVIKIFTPFKMKASQGDPLDQMSLVWVVGYTNPL